MRSVKPKKALLLIFLIVAVLVATAALLLLRTNKATAEIGNLQVFKGSAQVTRTGKTENGSTGTPIQVNDRIKVASGSTVAIILKDNTIIRLEGDSEAEIGELTYENGKIKDAAIKLTNGRAWSRVKPLESGSQFEVETPTVTAAVRGTSFNTTYKDNITGIYVYHSAVETTLKQTGVKEPVSQTQLLQMKQDSLQEDFGRGPFTPPESFFDEWIKFNQAEDDKLCRELRDIPGCESVGLAVVNTEANTAPTPSPTPTPPPPPPATKPKTPPPPPAGPTVQSLSVSCTPSPNNQNVYYQCSAIATLSNNQTSNVTNQTAWSVLYPQYGSISSTGMYTRSPNNYCAGNTVKGVYGGKENTATIPPPIC